MILIYQSNSIKLIYLLFHLLKKVRDYIINKWKYRNKTNFIYKDCKLNSATALTLHQCGIVQVFDITNINSPSLITLLKSDRPYSDFGAKVKVIEIL